MGGLVFPPGITTPGGRLCGGRGWLFGATASPAEEAVLVAAAARRAARIARVRAGAAGEVPALADDTARSVRLARLVMPEDAISGTLMFAGRLLAVLDEVAAISVIRYCRLP